MKRSVAFFLLSAALVCAQSAETIPYRVILSSANETPPVDLAASGTATVWLHVVRDAAGKVVSASTDMNASYTFPGDATITGMHIHRGVAGEPGPVLINSGINTANAVQAAAGRGTLARQGQTAPTDTAGLDAVNGILANPAGYYLNLHTTAFPNGVIRGQLQRAQMTVLMTLMSPDNETPPLTGVAGTGMTTITALRTPDGAGQVIFDATYAGFPEGTIFTGYHIHAAPAGFAGSVTVNTGLNGTNTLPAVVPGGTAHYEVDVPSTGAAADTLAGLFTNPRGYYANMHTTVYPNGIIRGQLRSTDRMVYPVSMSPANEVPPITGVDASAIGNVTAYTIRDAAGRVQAGTVVFDTNPRFAPGTVITGLHIHDGSSTSTGSVTIDSGIRATSPVTLDTGAANIRRSIQVFGGAAMNSLASMTTTPENQYFNMHTTVNPSGAIRAQLAGSTTAAPKVNAVISSVSDVNLTSGAPLGLMTLFGTNLFKVAGSLDAAPDTGAAMTSYNGTSITIGGKTAPLVVSGDGYMVIQVPADVATGSQPLVLTSSNGAAAAYPVTIASVAPGLYYDGEGGVILRNSDYSLIRNANPARVGDILLIYGTGLGQTTPALASGTVAPTTGSFNTIAAPVTVTVGGQTARMFYAIASPGYIGLYQIAIMVPAGVGPGRVPVVVRAGTTASNTVTIPVQ